MMRRIPALALMLLAPAIASADDPSATTTKPASPVDVLLGVDGPGRMTVPVKIGSNGPYNFTIDTGAERTVIARQLADLLQLEPGPRVRLTAMAGVSDVGTVVIPALTVSATGTTRVEAPALDVHDLGAVGLLGLDTLAGAPIIRRTPSTMRCRLTS